MPRVVDITTVHATTYSLADLATLALQVQRVCWPMTAERLHLFFHMHLEEESDLSLAASYPCTMLYDVLRLVRRRCRHLRFCCAELVRQVRVLT